ncbi:hypothetical protein BLOT_008165, partial [Blomia tropicalis]
MDFMFLIYAHMCIIMATFGTTSIITMVIKLKQIRSLLYPKHSKMPSKKCIPIVLKTYKFNNFVGIFIIHILIANVNEKLHCPVKRIIHLSVCDRKLAKFTRMKMKIHNYILAFHTKKKYGITYMSFGLISMFSFGK